MTGLGVSPIVTGGAGGLGVSPIVTGSAGVSRVALAGPAQAVPERERLAEVHLGVFVVAVVEGRRVDQEARQRPLEERQRDPAVVGSPGTELEFAL